MEKEYLRIIDTIIKDKNYNKLKGETHHHSYERYSHSIDVSYKVYKITRKLNMDYVSATRAAILHDYFFDDEFKDKNKIYKLTNHYKKAIENANKITTLSEKEQNIIASHMFPIGGKLPKHIESVIVDVVDDVVSIKEVALSRYNLVKTIATCLLISFQIWK